MLKIISGFCLSAFGYILLYCLLPLLPCQQKGLVGHTITLSQWVQTKAQSASANMQEISLAQSFIGNVHSFLPDETSVFQSSGLVHLLAISGGQILPLVEIIAFIFSWVIYKALKNKVSPHHIMQISHKTRSVVGFIVSLCVSILYGGTGALLRVAWLNFFKKLNFTFYFKSHFFKITPEIRESLIDNFIIILVVSLLFGNMFLNYSFVLSAIGASCAEICSRTCRHTLGKFKKENPVFLQKILGSRLFLETVTTIATCVCVGLVFSPLTSNSIVNSCLANIFAIPLVTFVVTPLSLTALFFPAENILFDFCIILLDNSLALFKHIAVTFCDTSLNVNNSPSILFTTAGLFYLNVLMILLWATVDLVRSYKLTSVQVHITSIKFFKG